MPKRIDRQLFKLQNIVAQLDRIEWHNITGLSTIPKLQKDLSYWLNSFEDHAKFFITQEMKNDYKNGESAKSILKKRKKLIIKEEKKFVESFSLEYTLESTPSQ